MMDDLYTALAAAFEFMLPVVLIIAAIKYESKRYFLVPVLGSASLFPLVMLYVLFDYYFLSPPNGSMHLAGFVMGLFFYVFSVIFGLISAVFIPKKVGLIWRYLIGFFVGPALSYALVSFL